MCVSGIVDHVALTNTLFLTFVTVLPGFVKGVANVRNMCFNNASLLVIINITLSAVERTRSLVMAEGCRNFVGWKTKLYVFYW